MEGSSSQFELDLQRREIEIQAFAEAEAEAEVAGEEEREALREEMVRFIEDSRRDGTRRARETSGRLENGLGRRSTLLVVSLRSFVLRLVRTVREGSQKKENDATDSSFSLLPFLSFLFTFPRTFLEPPPTPFSTPPPLS